MDDSAPDKPAASRGDLYQISRVIADTASDAIITIDEQSTMLFVNRAAEKIFGYSQAELIGKSLTILMPDYLRHVHRAGLQRYLSTGERHIAWEAVELPGLHKNGREVPLELSFGEFIEDGRRFFTGIARDITDRRKLERRVAAQFHVARVLAESDSLEVAAPMLLQAICESLAWEVGQLWMIDREAEALRWLSAWHAPLIKASEFEEASRNRTFVRGTGLPGRIWATGTPGWIGDVAADGNFPRGGFTAKAGLVSAFGFPIMVGREVLGVMEFFSRELHDADQSLLDLMNSIGNQIGQFVERQRAQEERSLVLEREQRARLELETTMNRMRQVQTVTDFALAHLSLDELLSDLLDRVRDALDVDTVAVLLVRPEGDELVAWAAKGLEEEVRQGVRIPLGSGFAGTVATQKSPLIISDIETTDVLNPLLREKGIRSLLGVPLLVEGRVIGIVHVGKFVRYSFTGDDVRLLQLVADRIALAIDHARLFEEERAARREAEAASRAKDEFLTTISHELRTPLTPIIGWVHMIRNGLLPQKETTHGLEVIEKNSHALKRLINDLLDMSAILSGKMRMEQLPVSLETAVREAIDTVHPFAAARDVRLELDFHDWHEEVVNGDRARLMQAFANLLNNAIKFSAPGGLVKITCETNSDNAIVRIEDSGQGIAAEFLPFVFERFRQEDGSKTRLHGGLGLGLALVKSFVEAHNGTVEAESAGTGHGSRFTVKLPRRKDVTSSSAKEEETRAQTISTRAHLMIIEDDPDTLEMLRATLEARGFRVTACESAAECLRVAANDFFDLIISDIGMPDMDGLQMMKQLRLLDGYKSLPAIALSGYASKKDASAAVAAGFTTHISKPVDPADLEMIVEGLLPKTPNAKSS